MLGEIVYENAVMRYRVWRSFIKQTPLGCKVYSYYHFLN